MTTHATEISEALCKLYELGDIQVISVEEQQALNGAGIKNSRQLVEIWRHRKERADLMERSGLSHARLRQITFCANIFCLEGPGAISLKKELRSLLPNWEMRDDTTGDWLAGASPSELVQYFGSRGHRQDRSLRLQRAQKLLVRFIVFLLVLAGASAAWFISKERLHLFPAWADDSSLRFMQFLLQQTTWRSVTELTFFALCLSLIFLGVSLFSFRAGNWGFDRIAHFFNATPRDVIIRQDAMSFLSPWQNAIFEGDGFGFITIGLLSVPIGLYVASDLNDAWVPLIGGIAYLIPLVWIIARFRLFHLAYQHLPVAWGESARRRIAGEVLVKLLWGIFLSAGVILVMGCAAWLSVHAWERWTLFQVDSLRVEAVRQRTFNEQGAQLTSMQASLEQTIASWQADAAILRNWVIDIFPVLFQLHRLGLLGLITALALGWYFFIEHEGWLVAFAGFTLIFIVEEIGPDYLVQYFYGPLKWLNLPALGYLIGFAWALSKKVIEDNRSEQLELECQECHRLWPSGSKACAGCGSKNIKNVLGFDGSNQSE